MDNSPASQPGNKPATVLDLFKDAIRLDGSIDGRSAYARSIKALQDEMDRDLPQATAAFLKRDAAILAVVARVIESHIAGNPESIFNTDGTLSTLITVDLIKIMDAKRKCLKDISELKRKKKGPGKGRGRDLDSISFD